MARHVPAIIIHGGCGKIEDRWVPDYLDGMRAAVTRGHEVLVGPHGTALDAVEEAVRVMEDLPAFNAGRGSVLTERGEVEMDAAIMDGRTMKAGAVGCLRNTLHPISVARRVMEATDHVLLVDRGAQEFASRQRFPFVPTADLVTERASKRLEFYGKFDATVEKTYRPERCRNPTTTESRAVFNI